MPFRFNGASCIAVGTFNIYIIQPAWLRKVGLLENVEGVALEADLTEPGFRMQLPDLTWRVEPTRIVLETKGDCARCGQTMYAIFDKLPWTPLKAIGINSRHEAPAEELDEFIHRFPHPASASPINDGYAIAQKTWHAAFRKDKQQFNLQLSVNDEVAALTTNVHTELRNESIETAKEIAENFEVFQSLAVKMAINVFSLDIQV
ncbi:MAG: hypothetical protein KY475_13020 [Planctomycetes bacterium]|nr:hypothetical protein [Planctomycetota bacterium]